MRTGFIGLGDQGGPIARRAIEAGYETTLWARRAETLEPFADTSAAVATSPAEVGARSDLVAICVLNDSGVEEVVAGEEGVLAGMGSGGVIAVHSTTQPDTCRRLAERAGAKGVTLIDAPVSGGGLAAAEHRLLVMVGGDDATVARCRPVFETYGDPVVHLGPVGAGQVAKLVNNLLFTAHLGLGTHAFELARSFEIEPGALAEVLAHGSGASFGLNVLAGAGYTAATLSSRAGPLLRKDIDLVSDLAAAAGVPLGILGDAAAETLAVMGVGRGSDQRDTEEDGGYAPPP
jgi:3-hydroxyisobutyrate dehydrogenase-like beta-hydroxyacid dehydrogenase